MVWINCLCFASTQPRVAQPIETREGELMSQITTVGVDLAKE
jgi:hypothetical protein